MRTSTATVIGRGTRSQRGLAPATELVIVIPAMMLMLGLVVAGGRVWFARSGVNEAAYSGARAASLERVAKDGAAAGRRAARAELGNQHMNCRTRSIEIDVAGFAAPTGKPAQVHTTLRCTVALGDLLLPGIPGKMILQGDATAALDTYRGR